MQTEKNMVVEKFKLHEKDTGSASVQIALLTERINKLNGHFKRYPKDMVSRHGFLKMISQRRRLLEYLKNKNDKKYRELIEDLNLRK